MRRTVAVLLCGVAAFFLALAALMRFPLSTELIAAPTDIYRQTVLRAEDASYFDGGTGRLRTGATLIAVNTLRGDVRASSDQVAVWDSFTSVRDRATKADVLLQTRRLALDRRGGRLVDCCDAAIDGDATVRQSGLGPLWPVGRVEKTTYDAFDAATRRTWPMRFMGTETLRGRTVYRFVQHVKPTPTGSIDDVSGAVLGLNRNHRYRADSVYSATMTVWVDPRTGSPVNQRQEIRTTLRTSDGADRLVTADIDLAMTAESQRDLIRNSDRMARSISILRVHGPIAAVLLGTASLIATPVLYRSGRSARRTSRGPQRGEPQPGSGQRRS